MSGQRADFQEVARQPRNDLRANAKSRSHWQRAAPWSGPSDAGGRWSCFVIRVPVSQGLLEVLLDGLEDHAVHQFLGFCQLTQRTSSSSSSSPTNTSVRARLGSHVNHGAPVLG